MGCVYKLDFPSGKSYIGITIRPIAERLMEHRRASIRYADDFAVHRAWRKYGEPHYSIIFLGSAAELKVIEPDLIKKLNTISPHGYNLSVGGDMPMVSDETRKKMSAANKGVKKSEQHRARMSAYQRGKTVSESAKANMKISQGLRDPSTRHDLSHFWAGKQQYDDHKAKKIAAYKATVDVRQTNRMAEALL